MNPTRTKRPVVELLVLCWAWRTRPKRERPQRIYRDDECADFADTIALSWVTRLYARHGTDEQLERIYHKWHTGHWRQGSKDTCTICGVN